MGRWAEMRWTGVRPSFPPRLQAVYGGKVFQGIQGIQGIQGSKLPKLSKVSRVQDGRRVLTPQ